LLGLYVQRRFELAFEDRLSGAYSHPQLASDGHIRAFQPMGRGQPRCLSDDKIVRADAMALA
jgi:hypothetical protein